MVNQICKDFGMKYPIFAFTHSVDVAIAVSNAGGMGVIGAAGMTPEELDTALQRMTKEIPNGVFGIDLILPNKYVGQESGGLELEDLLKHVPQGHKDFVANLLASYDVDERDEMLVDSITSKAGASISLKGAMALVEVAFKYPMKFLVNALGTFPADILERAHAKGIKVGALVGQVKHALKQQEAGCDYIIAQGYDAGGHTGDIGSMSLVPQVVDAVYPTPVISAGGIASGRQMAAAMALGAQAVWTGSVWLMSDEAETHPLVKQKFIAADASQTLRSRSMTGKPARQLRSDWTDAWEDSKNPAPLPMPLQSLVSQPARLKIEHAVDRGNKEAEKLLNYFVSQNVGMFKEVLPCDTIMKNLVEEYEATVKKFNESTTTVS